MVKQCQLAVALLAAMTLGVSAQDQATAPRTTAPPIPVNTAALDAHLKFLASDLLEGRAPATRGGRLATAYIAAQFEALGLEPAGASGTYFQPVALVGMTPEPTLSWGAAGAMQSLPYRDAFVAWAERPEADVSAQGDVVFVGYGIRAPEWQWDDYKGADLKGKIVLMLVNDPGLVDTTVFLGKILTYYGRWTYKLEEAARQGAAGAILIHTTESATYPWDVVRSSWSVEQFKLDQPHSPSLTFAGWVTDGAARDALAKSGLDLDSLMRAAARRDFRPVATRLQATVRVRSTLRHVQSENVAGRLPGRERRAANQVVLITAHWDHKGIGPAVRGDSIYNGAEDNASGVAAMLGVAQLLTQNATRPWRSIVFVATTAEESGLLGSEAYVQQPLIPLAQTAAVLNLDVTSVHGATRDISALGLDRSTLKDAFDYAARAESLRVVTQPDLRGSFFRSDHFPFARAGVPSLSIEPGVDFIGKPKGWGEEQERLYTAERYHQPSDEWQASFRYEGMAQQVRLTARLARAIANAPDMPRWLPNSEFQRPSP
jgi:Zn-dependent M28 family amino/carboxypeptidase